MNFPPSLAGPYCWLPTAQECLILFDGPMNHTSHIINIIRHTISIRRFMVDRISSKIDILVIPNREQLKKCSNYGPPAGIEPKYVLCVACALFWPLRYGFQGQTWKILLYKWCFDANCQIGEKYRYYNVQDKWVYTQTTGLIPRYFHCTEWMWKLQVFPVCHSYRRTICTK